MSINAADVISGLSLLLSMSLAAFYFRDRRQARFTLENDYVNDLLAWHGHVLDVLLRANSRTTDRDVAAHVDDLARLSSLIDQGRFFFPNIDKGDGFGNEKPPAYRGYRNATLDFLVRAHILLGRPATAEDRERVFVLQRLFTSIVFEVVRPAHRLATIHRLTDRYLASKGAIEDFIAEQDASTIASLWRTPSNRR